MPCLVHQPILRQGVARRVVINRARECAAVAFLGLGYRGLLVLKRSAAQPLGDDLIGIARIDRAVPISMDDDQRNALRRQARADPRTVLHGRDRGEKILGRTKGHAGMNADGGVQIGIRRRHDGRHGAARRHARDVHAPRIDVVGTDHLARHVRDDRRLALISPLMGGNEPIPASSLIGRFRLRGIQHEKALLLGERIHARAEREIIGILQAAVQHHQKRQRLALVARRNE